MRDNQWRRAKNKEGDMERSLIRIAQGAEIDGERCTREETAL